MEQQSLTALYLSNPELANALRRRQEAARLSQGGMDTSPIQSPWQGVARLAQGLIGGYEQGQADKEIKGAGDKRAAMMQALMADDMPAAPAAPAQAPMVQAPVQRQALAPAEYEPLIKAASDQTGVPAHLLSALYAQESGFRPDARNPKSTAAGIGQVLASTAANPGYGMAPLADADRLDPAKAIPWSAQYLAARGRSAGVSDWNDPQQAARGLRAYGENTPEYASAVLARAGGGQSSPQPQASATAPQQDYEALAARALQKSRAAMVGGDAALAAQFRQEATAYRQMAAQNKPSSDVVVVDRGGGRYEYVPKSQAGGLAAPEPRPMVSIQNTGESTFEKERAGTYAKRVGEWEDAGSKSAQTMTRLKQMETALDQFTTGAGSGTILKAGQIAQRMGVPQATLDALGINADQVASGEQIRSLASQMLVGMIGSGGFPAQGFSNADRDMLQAALPGLANSPQGNKMIINIMRASAQRDLEISKAWRDWSRVKGDNLASVRGFQSEILPGIVERGIVAPILEQGGWTDPTAGPAASAPPAPGAVIDGHRFKGGDPANPASWEPAQ